MAAPMQVRYFRNFCKLCINSNRRKQAHIKHRSVSTLPATEYLDEPIYPPVKPRYPPGTNWCSLPENVAWKWREEALRLREIPCVKERLEEIAKTEYLMWKVRPVGVWPEVLNYQQYITKTHLIHGLPNVYTDINVDAELELLKPLIINSILYHNCSQPAKITNLLGSYVQSLMAVLGGQQEYIQRAQVGADVRVETFWRFHGFDLESDVKLKGLNKLGHVMIQGLDNSSFQIRTELPLPEFVDSEDKVITSGEVPDFPYQPLTVATAHRSSRPISVSGHWIADPCEFSLASFHAHGWQLRHMQDSVYSLKELADVKLGAGIMSSFISTVSQAHNQGFNMYDDVTYPFTAQTIYTDGQKIQFFAYQLNTMHLWKQKDEHPLRNICWASEEMSLFEKVEDGKVQGFNDDVLKQIIKCLRLEPRDRGFDMRPYVPQPAPVNKKLFINHKGDRALPPFKPDRWQYPRNALYF